VSGSEGVPSREEPHKLCGSMKALQECMGPRAGKDRLCISYNEMFIYPGVSQIYTPCCSVHLRYRCISVIAVSPYAPPPPIAQSVSGIAVSLNAPHRLPLANLYGGGGGEKRIFPPQWPPSISLSSLNQCLQVFFRLPSSTVRSQIDHMYIYRDYVNTFHTMM